MEIRLDYGAVLAVVGAITLAGLYLFGLAYDRRVTGWQEHHGLDEGYVALEVVAGVAITVSALFPLWLVWFVWLPWPGAFNALFIWLSLLAGFLASGLPMIRGDILRHAQRKLNEHELER